MSRIPNTPDNAQLDQLNQEFSPVGRDNKQYLWAKDFKNAQPT